MAAIGSGTADRLAVGNVIADLVPDRFVAEGLLAAFPSPPPSGRRVLLARAAVARDVLPDGLREAGWAVDVVEAYRTEAVPVSAEARAAVAGADAITFTSSSTVERFLAAVGPRPSPRWWRRSAPSPPRPLVAMAWWWTWKPRCTPSRDWSTPSPSTSPERATGRRLRRSNAVGDPRTLGHDPPMAIDALVFDFDGLILDTELPEFVSLRAAFAAHGAELPVEEWRDAWARRTSATGRCGWRRSWATTSTAMPPRRARLDHHHALIAEQAIRPGVVALLDEAAAASSRWRWRRAPRWTGRRAPPAPRAVGPIRGGGDQRGRRADQPAPTSTAAGGGGAGGRPPTLRRPGGSAHRVHGRGRPPGSCASWSPTRSTEAQDFTHADLVVASMIDIGLDRLAGELERRSASGAG